MKRNYWWLLLGVALVMLLCCCVAAFAALGTVAWWNAYASSSEPEVYEEATPVLEPTQQGASLAEQETARLVAASSLPQRDLFALAQQLQGIQASDLTADPGPVPEYDVGDEYTFWVHDVETISFFTSTAVLRFETPHAYWWVEEGYDIPSEDLERSARRFEERTYPTNRDYFGGEWSPGIDGDEHVFIFLGNVPGVGGYFSSPDEYPEEIRPHSNKHEMFYINLDNAMPGNDYFDGVLAHEFQHMIQWAEDRNEDTWVSEGLAELAAHVNGYDVGGSDYAFTQYPDTQLTTWSELEDSSPHYGASYLFLTYFLEQLDVQAVQELVDTAADGIKGFDSVLTDRDSARSFDDLFTDWVIANYLDDPSLAAGRYGYTDVGLEDVRYSAHHVEFPVRERAAVRQYAADYILLEGEGDLTIEFTGTQVVSLVGNETYNGVYQWWSNRGDDGDATLTRAFDLSGLDKATLQAWMWYDLERDYDYAYVQVSTDGGQTWTLLANEYTTRTNPSGNSYGPALTGISGGGDEPRWVQQTFDLTPFAGEPVLVRFEVITDEALNLRGLCLDDIRVPELGYREDVETGDGGWSAEGWLRVTDQIPQRFVVQLISLGQDPQVQPLVLDEGMQGRIALSLPRHEPTRAVLVVSALAPATTEEAVYSYSINRD